MGIIELRTERLVLKKPEPEDLDALVTQIGDWEVAKWLARVPYPYTLSDAQDWMQWIRQRELVFNVYLNESLVGGVGLTRDDDDFYELGFWLGKNHWGHGFATEAAQCLVDHAMNDLNLSKIKSAYMQGNHGSANVLRKLGFREVGEGELVSLSHKATRPCIKLLLP